MALFGPAGTPAFSIQCRKQAEGPNQLVFIRYMAPNANSSATLSFTGNGQAASVPIAAVRNPDGIGGEWRAAIDTGDTARDVEDADGIWITEVWESEAHHKASLSLPDVKTAIAKARPIIAGFSNRVITAPVGGVGLPRPPA